MKMQVWAMFWGIFIILIGLSIVLKAFGINFPFFKFAFGALVIFIGISIIFPGTIKKCCGSIKTEREVIFGETVVEGSAVSGDYSAVFGSIKVDLTKVELKDKNIGIKINAVFAGAEVKVDPSMPIRIKGASAFGAVIMPNGNTAAFGESVYVTDSFKEDKPYVDIEASTVFGGIEIR
jgi:predicted membrane protein